MGYIHNGSEAVLREDGDKMLIYVAGPYRASSAAAQRANIIRARITGMALMKRGYDVIIPHMNTLYFEAYGAPEDLDRILEMDLGILERCDAIYLLPGWMGSVGTLGELSYSVQIGVPRIVLAGLDEDVAEFIAAKRDPAAYTLTPDEIVCP